MTLTGSDLALLTARFGCARFGASRFGFIPCPEDVHGVGFDEPGEYIWKEVKPPTTSWTLQTEDCVCGQRPVAGFSNVLCNAVGPVTFTDTSTPADQITFWYWTFGDGGTSSVQNPTHIYAAGYFTVTLTVSSDIGSATATGYVSVMSALVASAAPNPVDEGVDVTFTPTFSGGLAPYTYKWVFEVDTLWADLVGAWSLDEPSGTRYDCFGTKNLTEVGTVGTASGAHGLAGDFTAGYVTNTVAPLLTQNFTFSMWFKAPAGSASFTQLFHVGGGLLVGLFGHVLWIVNEAWGTTFRIQDIAPTDDGAWHHLVVWMDTGADMFLHASVDGAATINSSFALVAPFNPVANPMFIGYGLGGTTPTGLYIQRVAWFDAVLTAPQRAALLTGQFYGSGVASPVYAYPTDGAKVTSLTVTSATGCTVTDTVAVTVNASTLAVTFGMDPDPTQQAVDKDTVITFTPTVTPGVAPYTYDWDWGDGEAHGITEIPTHIYDGNPLGGTYTVVLTVTDATLATAIDSQTINIAGI